MAGLAAALVGTAPGVASVAVLVEALPRHLVCGAAITPGIWAQSWTTGNRTVKMQAIDRRTGHVWWHRKAIASKRHWRHWYLPSGRKGRCGATTFVYRGYRDDGSMWTARFRITFRSEGV